MSISALSSDIAKSRLVQLSSGEFTAASVAADQKNALRLGLVKLENGNFGAPPLKPSEVRSSYGVLSLLVSLARGGV